MVRWRYCLVLAMLLLLSTTIGSKMDDDDEEERGAEGEEEDDDDEEDEEPEETVPIGGDKAGGEHPHAVPQLGARRAPAILSTQKPITLTRTLKKRPLECYVCAYKSETPLRACLDPTKFRVHTMTCHSTDDQCFTSVIAKGQAYEAVVRGCRSGCLAATDTSCCELNSMVNRHQLMYETTSYEKDSDEMNRCNNQAFAMPIIQPQILATNYNKSNKSLAPNVLFFVTILLVVQTVGKVAFV